MKYQVDFEIFTERHFIKDFSKKHKGAWERTLNGLMLEFTYVDLLFEKSIAETICVSGDNNIKICKTEFKIAGTEVSRHASGNRCIIAVHQSISKVYVLLVYHKGDIGDNETAKWKLIIRENYPQYSGLL
jgi:hypothetical protein